MKTTQIEKLDKIVKILKIITLLIVVYIAYAIHRDIQEQRDFSRMITCEWYGHDQNLAPNFCK